MDEPISLAASLEHATRQLGERFQHRATEAALEPDDDEDLFAARAEGLREVRSIQWQRCIPARFQWACVDDFDGKAHADVVEWGERPAGRNVLVLGDVGTGKQAPVSEPVLTPEGWRMMGDLVPGDRVIGANGHATKVEAVFPQESREVSRVTMSDGSWTRCGPDHLWTVTYWGNGPGPHTSRRSARVTRTLSTSELVKRGLVSPRGQRRFRIPIASPAIYAPGPDLPIDPYTMGVLLGDAHINPRGYVGITTDDEILDRLNVRSGTRREHGSSGVGIVSTNTWAAELVALGLAGTHSWDKFVPSDYLWASVRDRSALLAGLLDTDGSPMNAGGVEFSTTSEALVDAVTELTQGLGGTARIKGPRITRYPGPDGVLRDGRRSWRVNVKLPSQPFTLARKAERWVAPTKYPVARFIESIEPDEAEDCVCIRVAADDGLYVTRDHIVTHNTHLAVAAARLRFDRGAEVRFLPVVELLDMLRPGGPEHALYDLADLEVLVLDDLGSERPTEWTAERLYALVNRRWLEERPTICTSNLSPTELEKSVGDRVFSRLVGNGSVGVKLSGPDRRRQGPKGG